MAAMIYFDNAATSFPKPKSVIKAVRGALTECGGNPGRASHRLARVSAEAVYDCREKLVQFLGAEDPSRAVFTVNATTALNIAVKGCLSDGDHVLISDMEHNSVYRPVFRLAGEGRIRYDIFPTYPEMQEGREERILAGIRTRIRPDTRAVVFAQMPNLCSSVLPVKEIVDLCREKGILTVLDASQALGHIPVRMRELGVDVLCGPGHKGLLAPMGVGFLVLREGVTLSTLSEGGSGVLSLSGEMPEQSPERYEAGTIPVPAIAGLRAGIEVLEKKGIDAIGEHDRELFVALRDRLSEMPGIRVFAPDHPGPVLLFRAEGISSESLGRRLDEAGFAVRSGFHCSALGHRTLGTGESGAVRVSFGIGNTPGEVDRFASCLKKLL